MNFKKLYLVLTALLLNAQFNLPNSHAANTASGVSTATDTNTNTDTDTVNVANTPFKYDAQQEQRRDDVNEGLPVFWTIVFAVLVVGSVTYIASTYRRNRLKK